MKKIFQRLINLISVLTVFATLANLKDGIDDAGIALLIGAGIVLTLNYVFFGAITVWHKFEKEETNE